MDKVLVEAFLVGLPATLAGLAALLQGIVAAKRVRKSTDRIELLSNGNLEELKSRLAEANKKIDEYHQSDRELVAKISERMLQLQIIVTELPCVALKAATDECAPKANSSRANGLKTNGKKSVNRP